MFETLAPRILPVVLANLTTRYPYHDVHFSQAGELPHDPFKAHPAFGNSFDWHSSVHSHWTALQLIEYFEKRSTMPEDVSRLAGIVAEHLSAESIAAETVYLREHSWYERPYGWAWAMRLAASAPQIRELAACIAAAAVEWLNVLPLPIRHGTHANTAFALGLMFDASADLDFEELQGAISARAEQWFASDRDYPEAWERSGNDFLSPGLTEADLMRRVLRGDEFAAWWRGFLPHLSENASIVSPATVPDVSDGHIVHLHGLNLSRAAMLARVGRTLNDALLMERARALYEVSVDRAVSGHYTETHWVPTFAWDAAIAIEGK